MLSAVFQLLLILAAMTVMVATIVWGVSADRSQIPPAPRHRPPAAHRRHGRHRAR
ncbi:hypothetical protein H0264_22500 [Nocardia huaxiensis]|uniref:Uncharacterized protein n=1 Tax=Nocardia huaxiensis TaxID=2755382 RepID=A0A7D6V5U6_9NOCA|nr:hypothetical protein H0264_22500 [Nocardia huaxiensis]